jgi:hypothetical protein
MESLISTELVSEISHWEFSHLTGPDLYQGFFYILSS